jgi:hypothetical protein
MSSAESTSPTIEPWGIRSPFKDGHFRKVAGASKWICLCRIWHLLPFWGWLFHNRSIRRRKPPQKFLAARRASRTAPETAVTATILIRFCVAIDNVENA